MTNDNSSKPEWTMSQERAFMEDLVSKRFNFFLVLFSLVMAGSISANRQAELITVLVVGSIICFLVSLTVYRAHMKLDQILKILHATPNHPIQVSGQRVKELGWKGLFGVVWIVGILPLACSLGLIVATALACFGCVKAG